VTNTRVVILIATAATMAFAITGFVSTGCNKNSPDSADASPSQSNTSSPAGDASAEGKGSRFWFTAVLDKQATGQRQSHVETGDIDGFRVLVVDDNATNRSRLRAPRFESPCWTIPPMKKMAEDSKFVETK